jgi:hypothetical protein
MQRVPVVVRAELVAHAVAGDRFLDAREEDETGMDRGWAAVTRSPCPPRVLSPSTVDAAHPPRPVGEEPLTPRGESHVA